jgi:mono/diheme cytochrome c family protein
MSSQTKKRTVFLGAGLALLVLLLLGVTGCRRNEGSAGALPKGQGNSAVAYGRTVFDAQHCVKCHSLGGQGGQGGPDLTHVGAKPGYTIDWFMLKVKSPRALNPASRMPAFDRMSPRDLVALGGYLAGLK